jgi:heme-degrading monooxygenase HmoA
MFIAVRKYRVRRGATAEWAQRVQDGFVPLMRELPGYRGYYLLEGGPDVVIAISMFDSPDEALMSNEKAADWVRNNVMQLARGMPEIMVGDVLVADVK